MFWHNIHISVTYLALGASIVFLAAFIYVPCDYSERTVYYRDEHSALGLLRDGVLSVVCRIRLFFIQTFIYSYRLIKSFFIYLTTPSEYYEQEDELDDELDDDDAENAAEDTAEDALGKSEPKRDDADDETLAKKHPKIKHCGHVLRNMANDYATRIREQVRDFKEQCNHALLTMDNAIETVGVQLHAAGLGRESQFSMSDTSVEPPVPFSVSYKPVKNIKPIEEEEVWKKIFESTAEPKNSDKMLRKSVKPPALSTIGSNQGENKNSKEEEVLEKTLESVAKPKDSEQVLGNSVKPPAPSNIGSNQVKNKTPKEEEVLEKDFENMPKPKDSKRGLGNTATPPVPFNIDSNQGKYIKPKEEEVMEKTLEIMTKTQDSEQVFGNFVGDALRNLRSDGKKRLLKRKIQALILEIILEEEDEQQKLTLNLMPDANRAI